MINKSVSSVSTSLSLDGVSGHMVAMLLPGRGVPSGQGERRERDAVAGRELGFWSRPVRVGIEQVVSRVFGVARGELQMATRGRAKVALARQVAMYLAHVVCGLSLTEVGRVFERDRTTVAHACGVVEDHRDDPTFDRVLDNLELIIAAWPERRVALDGAR